jgi:hypothetical protein
MKKWTHWFIIGTFVTLYAIVSIISTIHVIDFFKMSNPTWLAVSLAIAFEVGAAASLASIIVMDKMNKTLIWFLFILLTGMQMMGNAYFAYMHLEDYKGWIELFGLIDEEEIAQKRILSIISGAILPLVALGFIKSLVDYIRPPKDEPVVVVQEPIKEPEVIQQKSLNDVATEVWGKVDKLRSEGKLPIPSAEDIADEPTALANSQYRNEVIEDTEESISEPLENLHTEEEKRQLIQEVVSNSPNNPTSLEINNTNKELTEDDIKKYEEATKSNPSARDYHPQVFKR